MALKITHNKTSFGVGDRIRVIQKIKEGKKERLHAFEGIVISIKGHGITKSFTVRRIGVQQIGIERIFPLNAPTITKIEVVKKGMRGARRAKLYYIRKKSKRDIEEIYSRAAKRQTSKKTKKKK